MRSKKVFYFSWLVGITFCCLGFSFFYVGWIGYGVTLFCALPIALGIATGLMPDRRVALIGLGFALICFLIGLFSFGLEGAVCLIMALPIVLPFIIVGSLVAEAIKRYRIKRKENKIYISTLPFVLFIASTLLESFLGSSQIEESVSSTIIVPDSRMEVYEKIIAVDTVDVKLNILHKLGLPVPLKCILTEEKIGGLRICEFKEGQIIETITEFRKGELLRMDVTEFDIKGRTWLTFNEDIYEIDEHAEGTAVKRTTTYYSKLKPRFYWREIEKLTIKSEQDLVFRNLIKDLEKE